MRKTILMLINGFGIERKGSTEIYNSKLMPSLDKMTKETLFGSLITKAGDYNNAYRLFSIPEIKDKSEDLIDDLIFDKKLNTNETLVNVKKSLTDNNKLHIFYTIDTGKHVNHIKEFLKIINPNKDKIIYIHIIMNTPNVADYDSIERAINKLALEMGQYCKIGFIVGKNNINADDVLRTFYRELGEHWKESNKKFEILKRDIRNPEDAEVFIVTDGFALKENDSLLFLNYQNIDIDKFYRSITKFNLNIFSLYKLYSDIQNMFDHSINDYTNFAKLISDFNIKILILTTENRINDVNYYLNGMKAEKCSNITYAINDINLYNTKEKVKDLVDENDYDGIIIDYDIGRYNKLPLIQEELSKIDTAIEPIRMASIERGYTFIISSLYGMHAQVIDGVVEKPVDFSGKVPCIYQSNEFIKGNYTLNGSDTYGLMTTFITNISDEVKQNRLIHKLSSVEKMLSKK